VRFSPHGMAQQADAANFDAAFIFFGAVRKQTAGQHLQCGGLARAVVPEQSQHFSALQFQRHVMNGPEIAEVARQIACGKGNFGRNFLQSRVVVVVVSLTKYNLLCTSLSKAVWL
jgi:hypothetical protein